MTLQTVSTLTLRPYQVQLVEGVIKAIDNGDKSTLVIASTGAGKTVCMVRIAETLLENAQDDQVVLVLSHLSLLTIQTKKKFEKFSTLSVGVLQASQMPLPNDRVIISTMQSSVDFAKIATYYEICNKTIRYIIIDEAHNRYSNSYKEILSTFPNAQVIDFTATPFLKGKLATSVYDSIAFQVSLDEMITNKYLVPPVLRQIIIESDITEKKCALFMKTYLELEAGKKAIFFMRTKEECKLLRDSFIAEGVKAAIVVDSVTGVKRDKVFDGYEADEFDVLISVNVLTAGWDSMVCEAIFMQGTSSPTVYMQRIGRGLRPQDGDSVKPHHSKQNCRCYVFGELPEIESGEIEKIHNTTIKPKKYEECITFEEKADWLELADMTNSDEYALCKASIKVQRLAKKINLETLLRLIDEKAIPSRFMMKLATGADTFKNIQGGDRQASATQVNALKSIGVNSPKGLTSNEASFLIHSLTGKQVNHHNSQTFVAQSGRYKGSHVKDIPWAFKSVVVKKFPNSDIAKQIKSYHNLKDK